MSPTKALLQNVNSSAYYLDFSKYLYKINSKIPEQLNISQLSKYSNTLLKATLLKAHLLLSSSVN